MPAASVQNLVDRVRFHHADASEPLPFSDSSFDGLICIDAINHLPDRRKVIHDWARVLGPGGHLVFTDPIVVTGLLTNQEIAIRSSIGFFLFAAPDVDARLLREAGFDVCEQLDRTKNMAEMARRWVEARQRREEDLRTFEGDPAFEGQQAFFRVASTIPAEGRLPRFAYHAVKRERQHEAVLLVSGLHTMGPAESCASTGPG